MNTHDKQRIEQNVRHTSGIAALRKVRTLVDADLEHEKSRARWLRALLRYGWIMLPLAAGLLAYFLGVI